MSKDYSLKQSEIVLLSGIQQQANAIFSQAVAYILVDRLAYPVTESTRFSVEGDKLTVWEDEPNQEPSIIADATKEEK